MNTTTRQLLAATIATLSVVTSTTAAAHGGGDGADLHVGDAYDNCYFDLSSELTQAEFDQFAAEAGAVARFHQLSGARTLGKWNFEVSVALASSTVDDSDGAWNNTMKHPEDDHYLGDTISFPSLRLRMGVSDDIDVGLWGTLDPASNYGFAGLDAKFAVLSQTRGWPVSVAVRPHVSTLVGPEEVWLATGGVDGSVSYDIFGIQPYAGAGVATSAAFERSDDVDLDTGMAFSPVAFAGIEYNWSHLSVGVEGEISEVPTWGVRVGGSF